MTSSEKDDIAKAQLYAQKFLSYLIVLISVFIIQLGVINHILPQRIYEIKFNGTVYQARDVISVTAFQLYLLLGSLIIILLLAWLVFRTSIEMYVLERNAAIPSVDEKVKEWLRKDNSVIFKYYYGICGDKLFGSERYINTLLLISTLALISFDIPVVIFVLVLSFKDVSQYVWLLWITPIILFIFLIIPLLREWKQKRKDKSTTKTKT